MTSLQDNQRSYERAIAGVLLLVASLAAAPSAALAKDLDDLAKFEACRPDMDNDTKCRCEIGLLHPTQMSVGMIQVEAKVDQLKKKEEPGKLYNYLEKKKHREPVVIGPNGVLYITDHHHLAVALKNIGVKIVYCQIVGNRRNQKIDDFWTGMVNDGKAWPENADGERRPPQEIPSSVDGLKDDPYRSLAGEVRESCGYQKTKEYFAEFKWADFFRRTNVPETGRPISAQLIQSNMDDALEQAMELAKSPDAKDLPGYLPIPCKGGDND
jgi:hypothetical protein